MVKNKKVFVGFGFGPIQSALFLYEAYRSGNFGRFVVSEVDPRLVQAVRANHGRYVINIAHPDRIEPVTVAGVELYNPAEASDREAILQAIAAADELATALPSVNFYTTGGEASVVGLLLAGLARRPPGPPVILYTAENNNHAAEILAGELARPTTAGVRAAVETLNTVIGKMSGVITDEPTIRRLGLQTLTPATPRAVLVEAFNRILISRIRQPGYQRGIAVFEEKDDLLPFEEAKLYGHNAIHALIGYLSRLKGLTTMAEAAGVGGIMNCARQAFVGESGPALVKKYAHLHDPLFTPEGFTAYAEDLLQRMVNPNLNDLVARVVRDPVRKLGYEDRLFGAMRLALGQGIPPTHLAWGTAAGVRALLAEQPEPALKTLPACRGNLSLENLTHLLQELWGNKTEADVKPLIDLTFAALGQMGGGSEGFPGRPPSGKKSDIL